MSRRRHPHPTKESDGKNEKGLDSHRKARRPPSGSDDLLEAQATQHAPYSSMSSPNDPEQRILLLKRLVNTAFQKAKRWSCGVISLQLVVFFAGLISVFWSAFSLSYPWVALPLAAVAAYLATQAAKHRSLAESLKRQHELADGLGKAPSCAQLADTKHALGELLPEEVDSVLRPGITYSSAAENGSQRLLENLVESAWFSKHLARWCSQCLCAVFLVAAVLSVSILLWCASHLDSPSVTLEAAASKLVSATLLFMLSVGLIRTWLSFSRFADKSQISEQQCTTQLGQGRDDTLEAMRLLTEYQLARASAPAIPTWVWKYRKAKLNHDWEIRKASL